MDEKVDYKFHMYFLLNLINPDYTHEFFTSNIQLLLQLKEHHDLILTYNYQIDKLPLFCIYFDIRIVVL